jgi:hypothetical protein
MSPEAAILTTLGLLALCAVALSLAVASLVGFLIAKRAGDERRADVSEARLGWSALAFLVLLIGAYVAGVHVVLP